MTRQRGNSIRCLAVWMLTAATVIAATPSVAKGQEAVQQQVLRLEVQRFVMSYAAIMGQAFDQLEQTTQDPAIRTQIQNRRRAQTLAAVNIALGENPGVNLLDAVVLAALSRTAIENHWGPKVFGRKESQQLLDAYVSLERAAWDFAGRFLTDSQIRRFRELIVAWRKGHRDSHNVEFLRIDEFLDQVPTREQKSSTGVLSFLMPSVGEAGQAIDRAALLGERVMTLAQFYPILVHQEAKHFLFEIFAEKEVRQLLAHSTTLTGEVTRFNGIVDTMPEKVAQQITLQREALMQDIDNRKDAFGKIVQESKATVELAVDLAKHVDHTAGLVVPVIAQAQSKGFTSYDVVKVAKEALQEANVLVEAFNQMLVANPAGDTAQAMSQAVKELNAGVEAATNRVFFLALLLIPFTVVCCVAGAFGFRLLSRRHFGSPA